MKTTKKTVANTAKKEKKSKSRAVLLYAHGPECFWVTDGKILANLIELRDALSSMADEVYKYHVVKGRNDFADWVESVLDDKELGKALRKSKKPSTAWTVVARRLKIYDI